MTGYLVQCIVCEREQYSGDFPVRDGWPKCCGYTMRLVDTERFKADVDKQVGAAFEAAGTGEIVRVEAPRS
jgi:hypothetical protein